MKYFTKYSLIFCIALLSISCSMQDKDNKANNAIDSTTSTQSITVSGVVKAIQNGKDGYIADIETEKNGTYAALVSIANLGGIKNFIRFKVGDKVTVNGILSILDQKNI